MAGRPESRNLKDNNPVIASLLPGGGGRDVATVSETTGSTPRSAGATMLIRPDGSMVGTIGGGCGEAEVWQGAMDTMQDGKPRTIVVDLTEPT